MKIGPILLAPIFASVAPLLPVSVPAQTNGAAAAPAASPETTLDPAKVAEYQRRFEQGYALEQQGKLKEARDIYDAILAEEPDAKRSLLEAGKISIKLNELEKASDYFSRLHTLVPDYPAATELLIQVSQALGRDVKVELLLREFRALHASGKIPEFTQSPNFVRQRLPLDQNGEVVMTEFFDYTQEPYIVWIGERHDAAGTITRQLMLRYDPDATKAIRAKDPRLANAEEFLLVDDIIQDRQITRIDVFRQLFALPDYKKLRNTMLAIMAGTMKPIYSQPVGAPNP
jgi:tetratricopeptide (TPR) repeat protein